MFNKIHKTREEIKCPKKENTTVQSLNQRLYFRKYHDTKQSNGKVPVMLELWGMQSTPSMPLFPGPFRPGVASPDRVLSMDQIELNCVLMLN